jgi:hypothetical protein
MLQQQENIARQQSQMALQRLDTPTWQESMAQQRGQEFFDWERSTNKDIRTLPGMSSYLQVGAMAQQKGNAQRMGSGAFQLAGTSAGSEQYANQLREFNNRQNVQNIGLGLETALMNRQNEAVGALLPFGQMAVQKDLGRVGATTQMLNSYLQAPRSTPFWQSLVLAGIGGAGSVIQGFNK